MVYRFGEFLYDPLNRTLSQGEEEIALTPKTRDLLALFLENPKRLLTRQAISDRLWPDVAVTDDALRFQVAELRKALGRESEGFLRTIPREGYRWEVEVQREERAGARAGPNNTERCYRLFLESREVGLEEGENLIGNSKWSFNVNGLYELPWGFNFAANLFGRQGYPFVNWVNINPGDGLGPRALIIGKLGDRRFPNVFNADVRVEKVVTIKPLQVRLSVDVFNVANSGTVLQREGRVNTASYNTITETLSPRVVRAGVRISF